MKGNMKARASTDEPTGFAPKRHGPPVRRSPMMMAAGVVLAVAGALTSVGLYTHLSQTQEVIAIVSPVARGEQIKRSDLMTVQVGYDPLLTPVPGSRINEIVGMYAASDLVPGTFLTERALGEQLTPGDGMAEIGVALAAGEYPDDGLRPGDEVLLIALSAQNDVPEAPHGYSATLVRITAPNSSNMITASLLVNAGDAPLLAALSAANRLAVVLTTRER